MGVKRYLNTDFWDDPWILELNPKEKLVMLYLLTNDRTNMLGAYELSLKVTEFELGIPKDQLEAILQEFEESGKVVFKNGFLVIINWAKNKSYNRNMLKNANQSFEKLKDEQKGIIPISIISEFQKLNSLNFKQLQKLKWMLHLAKISREREAELTLIANELCRRGTPRIRLNKY